jgi:hypothetical protein
MKKFTVTFNVPAEVTMVVKAEDIGKAIRDLKASPMSAEKVDVDLQWAEMHCVGAEPDDTPEA